MPLRRYTIQIYAGDLLHGCPSQRMCSSSFSTALARNHDDAFTECYVNLWRPWVDMRRRWSGRMLELAAPVAPRRLPLDEIQFQSRMLTYWMCRSGAFWKAVGPRDLLAELATIRTRVWGTGASLYLCQHEIRGD